MKNVKLNFLLILCLILSFPYQGNADCPPFVKSNTFWEAITGRNWVKEIKVQAIKDQGTDGYFNPKIRVCAYDGKSYCYELNGGTSCRQIYGTQSTGAGVSAMTFIDWEGNKTSIGAKMGEGLEWEWADGVTQEEQEKFANSPKICACSQKGACMSGISSWGANFFSGENIFHNKKMEDLCDTCYQTKIKCAPIQLAPGPPPFCKQLEMSPTQVRIVPIADKDNDYFDSRVKVIVGNLQDSSIEKRLDFPDQYGKDNAKEHSILGEGGVTHYFKTYREKNKLYAEYHGTKGIDENKSLQFTRSFPAPHAPEPTIVEIVKDQDGSSSNTLKIKMKMSNNTCGTVRGKYSDGFCTFDINNSVKHIGPLFFKVVKPAIKQIVADTSNNEMLKKILSNNEQFKILEEYKCTPDILIECSGSYALKDFGKEQLKKCKLDNLGQPEIEVKYKENLKSKMLCLSGWKPDPEEFFLDRGNEIISLKSIGAQYIEYNAVFSKESKKFYYFPSNKAVDILGELDQRDLDEIVFNKQGYISIHKLNEGKSHCTVDEDKKLLIKQDWSHCKLAYELTDGEYKDPNPCNQDEDGCFCPNGQCSRSTQYVNKKDNKPFYLKYEEASYKDEHGKIQKGIRLKDQLTKVNRSEVFYANKLCRFDLSGLTENLKKVIETQLKHKKEALENKLQKPYDLGDGYTDDLSIYDYVEIEAWGGGEAGHIRGKASSRETRSGMPGDYIKAKLKIDPNYPFIQVKVTEGGGGREGYEPNKDGGPTIIKMCKDNTERDCKDFITVAGGGKYRTYGGTEYKETKVHRNLKQGEFQDIAIAKVENTKDKDKQVAYIENGQIKYESMRCDNLDSNNVNSSGKYGAGGCIDQNGNGKNYSKGAPGYAKIKPILGEITGSKVDSLIEEMIKDSSSINKSINNQLIETLDPDVRNTIKDKITTELLGQ